MDRMQQPEVGTPAGLQRCAYAGLPPHGLRGIVGDFAGYYGYGFVERASLGQPVLCKHLWWIIQNLPYENRSQKGGRC